jgi:hydroxymethylpyrimidine/phosphomethylpyrimidine kinase
MAVVTPNLPEFESLIGAEERALEISKQTAIYLKGGHSTSNLGVDILYLNGEKHMLEPKLIGTSKHGSGCVLASAICANLALGFNIWEASVNAKKYIESVLTSNDSLLGWHARNDR